MFARNDLVFGRHFYLMILLTKEIYFLRNLHWGLLWLRWSLPFLSLFEFCFILLSAISNIRCILFILVGLYESVTWNA